MEVKSIESVLMNYKVEKVGISVRTKISTKADPHPNVISFGICFEKTVYYNLSYFIYGVTPKRMSFLGAATKAAKRKKNALVRS